LGLGLGWNARSILRTAVAGMLLSAAVEIAQLWIPGRDPSLSDVIFNTIGTLVGALLARGRRTWLSPDTGSSARVMAMAIAAMIAIGSVTAFMLAPSSDATSLTKKGVDLMLAYPTRADHLGLDAPVYWFSPPTPVTDTRRLSVVRDRLRWLVISGSDTIAAEGPTIGVGWTLLAYPDALARRWGAAADAIWVMLLCAPVGFLARGRVLGTSAGVAIVLVFTILPFSLGMVATPLMEWLGAGLGFFCGLWLGGLAQRMASQRADTGAQ
jgi:hypothetical protein